ncbi:hypothetical protein [Streptomyces sp. ITFR-16]|uniref:hypothetical protein n=1 Tax=Streptomyces sp. ITFR-16 TaxID=3075198 RepID=UPI00288A59BB|nr:hypothetical protein [Streptomyces sp. ITFR-16]WNI23298.1 hypothetical protein RLT58_15775 [Streptomyces sp. ITFR-16]
MTTVPRPRTHDRRQLVVTGLAASALLAASAVPSVASGGGGARTPAAQCAPAARLPRPTGPFGVGSTTLRLVDRSRPEPWAPDASPYRELMITVRYPAAPGGPGRPVPHMTAAAAAHFGGPEGAAASRAYELSFFDRWLRGHNDHLLDGPSARFPEMVFSR